MLFTAMNSSDSREIKRVRQACLNCRRKKVRCSGDKPVCAFCARLGQQCLWDNAQSSGGQSWRTTSYGNLADSDLAARVALLESQLSVMSNDGISNLLQQSTSGTSYYPSQKDVLSDRSPSARRSTEEGIELIPSRRKENSSENPPTPELIQALVDTYFIYCQNQPYCYFHEASFRKRLDAGAVPDYLLYSILATAVKFSDHAHFEGKQSEYTFTYSQAAWAQLLKYSFSFEEVLDLTMVQSMSMLAAIDFTLGHKRLGWVKIGLSVRFAQGLRLYHEPSHQLRPSEQEEMRRTFWSIYVMDRLVSTGPDRPPTFVDEDCTVQLPCHEQLYQEDLPCGNSPTLTDLAERPDNSYSYSLDNFALGVLMASSLGQIVRYGMKKESSRSIPPWDHRSQYNRIYGSLLYFESYSVGTSNSVTETIEYHFTSNGIIDQHRAGHFIFSRALYHLNQCLLNHPFLLHQRFVACTAAIPPSFVTEALRRGRKHAGQLTELLYEARRAGCVAESSWYGYCSLAAGLIHKLFQHHDDVKVATESKMRLQMNFDFLERQPVRWDTYARMGVALRSFNPEVPTCKALVTTALLARKASIHEEDSFWCLIDYGWLSDSAKDHTTPHATTSDSFDFEGLDIGDETINPALLTHKEPVSSGTPNEMKNILGDDMGGLFAELLGFEQPLHS